MTIGGVYTSPGLWVMTPKGCVHFIDLKLGKNGIGEKA